MNETIEIIDRGRGPQLSTSRVTVLDLVPYFQEGCSSDEMRRWIPTLSEQEISVAEQYYRAHKPELDEQDRLMRAFRAEQIRLQQLRFPTEDRNDRLARLNRLLQQRQQERNGEGHPG